MHFSVNTSSPISSNSHDELDQVNGDGEQLVIKTQPDLPKYALQPMAIGEKLNLKFEVSCGLPVIYEWMKQGVREDVMTNPASSSVKLAITPVSNGRELVGEVVRCRLHVLLSVSGITAILLGTNRSQLQ